MPENLNINEILNLVKKTNKELETKIYIPSLQTEVIAKTMNASHLKGIIKTSVSGVFSNNVFNQTVYSILSEILETSQNNIVINTFDKIAILLQLRCSNVKSSIDVELVDSNTQTTKTVSVELLPIIEKIKQTSFSFTDYIINEQLYEVTLNYPTIDQEFLFDRSFEQTKIKKIDENNKESLKDLFGPLFIQEIALYIKNIKIPETNIDFYKLPVLNRIDIVESLSSSLITKIISTIDSVFGKQISDIIQIEREIDSITYKGMIPLNSSLFA